MKTYTDGVRAELAGTGVTVATLCPGPVRTEFLQAAGMDEKTFAEAFPKFLWMPSRDVARVGVDALDDDRGTVIPGLPSQLSTRLLQAMPRRVLLSATREATSRHCAGTAAQSADCGQRRIQSSTGRASPLHSVQIVRYHPTATSSSIRCSSSRSSPSARHVGSRPRPGALHLVDRTDQDALGCATSVGRRHRRSPARRIPRR